MKNRERIVSLMYILDEDDNRRKEFLFDKIMNYMEFSECEEDLEYDEQFQEMTEELALLDEGLLDKIKGFFGKFRKKSDDGKKDYSDLIKRLRSGVDSSATFELSTFMDLRKCTKNTLSPDVFKAITNNAKKIFSSATKDTNSMHTDSGIRKAVARVIGSSIALKKGATVKDDVTAFTWGGYPKGEKSYSFNANDAKWVADALESLTSNLDKVGEALGKEYDIVDKIRSREETQGNEESAFVSKVALALFEAVFLGYHVGINMILSDLEKVGNGLLNS